MKQKGFTLIEILAVIVILAIITLIAVPLVSNAINNSKIRALKSSAYGLIEASKLYYAHNGSNNIRFNIDGSNITSEDTTELLNYKGSVKRGTVIINKMGDITLCITDGTNSAYKNYNDNKVEMVERETCSIPENKSIVYLENSGATTSEFTNEQLADEIESLKSQNSALQEQYNTLQSQLIEVANLVNPTSVLEETYPVGSIYMSTTEDTAAKVKAKLKVGTWEKIEDKFLLAAGSSHAINTTGGAENTTLALANIPSHSHTVTATGTVSSTFRGNSSTTSSSGAHQHKLGNNTGYNTENGRWLIASIPSSNSGANFSSNGYSNASLTINSNVWVDSNGAHTHTVTPSGTVSSSFTGSSATTSAVGSGTSFTNMPPYVTVYVYKRIS